MFCLSHTLRYNGGIVFKRAKRRMTSTVPRQWKQLGAHQAVPKVPSLQQASDYRPISISPVRLMGGWIVVRRYVYPALTSPCTADTTVSWPVRLQTDRHPRPLQPSSLSLVNTVINLLAIEPYVIVLSFDFSKAFDTVRHFTLLQKFAELDLPDQGYIIG